MTSGAKVALVLAAGLVSALATAAYIHRDLLIPRQASSHLEALGLKDLVPDAEPRSLLDEYLLPSRDKVRELIKGSSDKSELAREVATVVQASSRLLDSEQASQDQRQAAEKAELETLYLASTVSPEEFGAALLELCDHLIKEKPGSDIAAHADVYKILYQYFGAGNDDAGALLALTDFAKKYPDNKLGADLFIAYSQRQNDSDAKATLDTARRVYTENPLVNEIDKRLAALRTQQMVDADSSRSRTKKAQRESKKAEPQRKVVAADQRRSPPTPAGGGRRITFSAPTFEGRTLTTAQFQGKVVLIDFWATWCGPCVREIPNVKAVYDKYHRKGLEVIGVSLDNDPERLKEFLKQNNMQWPQVFFPGTKDRGWNNPIAKRYGIRSIPTMFLLDRSGRLVTTDLRGHGVLERAVEEQLFGTATASRD